MKTPTEERVVFAVSFEAMFVRALGATMPAELRQSLAAMKIQLESLEVAYPLQTWKRALAEARRILHPNLPDAEAYEQLGRIFVRSYFETFLGRAVKPLLKVIGTSRSLDRMRQNFRGGNNFSDATLEKTGEKSRLFHINDDLGHPSFVLGIIQEGMVIAVEPTFRMTVIATDPPKASYRCTWE